MFRSRFPTSEEEDVDGKDRIGPFDALDALAEVRMFTPTSPFIVVTRENDRQRAAEATLRGPSAYVSKNDLLCRITMSLIRT